MSEAELIYEMLCLLTRQLAKEDLQPICWFDNIIVPVLDLLFEV
jgi:hypothetical protein